MNKQIKNNTLLSLLSPGDHIAGARKMALFEHHGIYVGVIDGVHMATHFKAPINNDVVSKVGVAECTLCGYTPQPNGGIVTSCLHCFSRGQKIYVIKYKVPPPDSRLDLDDRTLRLKILRGYRTYKLYFELHEDGKLIGHVSIEPDEMKNEQADKHVFLSKFRSCRSPGQVLAAAQSNHYMGKYSLMFNNCEDFAVYCMTGKERSIQTETKLHKVPYYIGKKVQLLTDRHKMKAKLKEKALSCLARSF